MKISQIEDQLISDCFKGIPGGTPALPLVDIATQGWNLLREDLPLPVAVLRESAIENNSRWMKDFLALTDSVICPHGKTTMSPQLFKLQLDDGAWGITAATAGHVQIYRRFGVPRILLANQLVGRQNIRAVLDELRNDPEFDFYCLIDSVAGIEALLTAIDQDPLGRPVQVLLEIGLPGGRTGAREDQYAMDLARRVRDASPRLSLCGIEAFEGILQLNADAKAESKVEGLLERVVRVAESYDDEDLFGDGPVILTAGGSSFFDMVAAAFTKSTFKRPKQIVLRSGCYLTHDSKMYAQVPERIAQRMPGVKSIEGTLKPALEVWGYVQSLPEVGLAIATVGKRDISHDADLPIPLAVYRPGADDRPRILGEDFSVSALNDQHAYVRTPDSADLQVGDMIAFGVSHPCTTFDKWQLLLRVDDDYNVTGAVRTFF